MIFSKESATRVRVTDGAFVAVATVVELGNGERSWKLSSRWNLTFRHPLIFAALKECYGF